MGDVLLVAGPTGLDTDPANPELLAGSAAYAAVAAGPLAPVQLWARGGESIGTRLRQVLAQRRIEDGGLGEEGASLRFAGAAGSPSSSDASILPEVEPVDASDLGAVLLIDLPAAEMARALQVVSGLPDAEARPTIIVPPLSADGDQLRALAASATVLQLPLEKAATALGIADPVACGQALIGAGATSVLLTDGPLGGLSFYKQKVVTWPASPRAAPPRPGTARAVFAGVLAGQIAGLGRIDWRNLKRFLATAGAVAAEAARKDGPKHLMGLQAGDYHQQFLRLRRNVKF